LQEDVDAVGLSLLSGAHLTLFPRVMDELRARGLGEVLVFGGGVIPDADAAALKEQGVAEIFGPGSSLKGISAWLEAQLDQREEVA
ncbi:MAG TPA: cobalamin-dependent protein, partial [Ilumatobacteraceae bacterium]|nr:cobalamin-dependent protein [Ilumatobacteraceae bacterium]